MRESKGGREGGEREREREEEGRGREERLCEMERQGTYTVDKSLCEYNTSTMCTSMHYTVVWHNVISKYGPPSHGPATKGRSSS